jgi:hypothetical protein
LIALGDWFSSEDCQGIKTIGGERPERSGEDAVMNLTRDGILARLAGHRETIRADGVRRLGLFGSASRGESTTASDLDFLVEFERKSFDSYMDLKAYLESRFACPVDLVIADALKPRLREPILNETVHAPGL